MPVICNQNISRSMLTAESPQIPSASSQVQLLLLWKVLLLLLAAIHPLLLRFFTNLFLFTFTCMKCTESLMGKPPSSLLGKPIIFHASVVLCLCSLTAFALHSVFIHNKNTGLLWPEIPSYTDFCIYFRVLCFSFLASIWKDKIRPLVPLPNLILMSGWLTFLSLVLLAFIPQPHCPPA